MKVCQIDGCEQVVKARGWCNAHYQRWYVHGDPLNHGQRKTRGETVHGTPTAHNNHGCRCELCKEWHRTYAREWAAANRDKRRATQWKNRYGITPDEYDRMLARQGGGCAICGSPPRGKRKHLYVDHCHAGGQVRALLCHMCNAGLGMFEDDPDRLLAAATYLLQFTSVLEMR